MWTSKHGGRVRTQQPINEHFAATKKIPEKESGRNDFGPGSGDLQRPGRACVWMVVRRSSTALFRHQLLAKCAREWGIRLTTWRTQPAGIEGERLNLVAGP